MHRRSFLAALFAVPAAAVVAAATSKAQALGLTELPAPDTKATSTEPMQVAEQQPVAENDDGELSSRRRWRRRGWRGRRGWRRRRFYGRRRYYGRRRRWWWRRRRRVIIL